MSQHKYAHQIDPEGGSAAARIARMIEPGLRVLELGCGPGTVTRMLHAKGCRVTGMDMDEQALEVCRPFCERVIQADLSAPGWVDAVAGEVFDVVVLADVLEHLIAPQDLLGQLQTLLTGNGYVVLSVPNASHLTVVGCMMAGHFPYQSTGLLDRTHVRFFGRSDIDKLLLSCGFLAQRWECVEVMPLDSELAQFWNGLTDAARHFLQEHVVNGLVYQHVVKAYPSSQTGYVAKLQAELAMMQTQMQVSTRNLTAAHAVLVQQITKDCENALAARAEELKALKSSHSWRITGPMRAVKQWLSGSN